MEVVLYNLHQAAAAAAKKKVATVVAAKNELLSTASCSWNA
jgi:hypothetical protein